jgi:uncharacterized protein (UPF0305 family)
MASQLDRFLELTAQFIHHKNGESLKAMFVVDFDHINENQRRSYEGLNKELLEKYPEGRDGTLEERCSKAFAKGTPDGQWNSFTSLMVVYLRFVREYLTYSLRDKLFKVKDIAKYVDSAAFMFQNLGN